MSKYGLPLRKDYGPQLTQEIFGVVAIAAKKPPTYPIKAGQDEIMRGTSYQKELIKLK